MKQIFIIGLGKFGSYLATELYQKGHEVIAIDKADNRINEIKDRVSQAIIADATDIKTLKSLGVEKADLVIVCIGTNQGQSILVCYNLVELNVKNIIAKSISEAHGKILKKVGATEILFPERDLAMSFARKINNPNMLDYIPFVDGYNITEISPSQKFVGKKLKEINLINDFGTQIIAIKDVLNDKLSIIPKADYIIKDSDILILFGPEDKIEYLKN